MDTLENELLLYQLNDYGYQLAKSATADPQVTLARMIDSTDLRILEGVPVVLTNILMHGQQFDFSEFEKKLPSGLQRRFRVLASITYFFLLWVPESAPMRTGLFGYLRNREPALLGEIQEKLTTRGKFAIGGNLTVDTERLENTYKNYVVAQFYATKENLAKKLDQQRQIGFLQALKELFTEKQIEILFKFLNGKEVTKTEREYYARRIKPRLKAISNIDVQSFSSNVLSK